MENYICQVTPSAYMACYYYISKHFHRHLVQSLQYFEWCYLKAIQMFEEIVGILASKKLTENKLRVLGDELTHLFEK